LAPFAVHCVLIGLLIMRSIFLPRVLGMLVLIAGLAYLIFDGGNRRGSQKMRRAPIDQSRRQAAT